jgi:hypothetical protein
MASQPARNVDAMKSIESWYSLVALVVIALSLSAGGGGAPGVAHPGTALESSHKSPHEAPLTVTVQRPGGADADTAAEEPEAQVHG